jgi:Ca-activated chloride channel family protein
MNDPLDENPIKQLISRYVDGQVAAHEKRTVEEAIKTDAQLAAYYRELKRLNEVLETLPQEGVSPDWEKNVEAVMSQIEMKKAERTLRNEGERPSQKTNTQSFFHSWVPGVTVVLTFLMIMVALQSYIKRGIQGRLISTLDDIGDQYQKVPLRSVSEIEASKPAEYEPYYLDSRYAIPTDEGLYGRYEKDDEAWRYNPNFHTEEYSRIDENYFKLVTENPLSTFSIDVDTASYSNVRRFITSGHLPPPDAVRIEEMINYFSYHYPQPEGKTPFAIAIDGTSAPWSPAHKLIRIGIQGRTLDEEDVPPSNLVFLIDVSGSMDEPNKLPLLKEAMKLMVKQLTVNERVAIVVYAGSAGQVLESTPGDHKHQLLSAINRLEAGGSTAGGAGIQLAYQIAQNHFIKGGNNRVVLATDGDFNVGVSSDAELVHMIEEKRGQGVFLTVLGFGTGNYKDSKMEQLANKGNGNYFYIDTKKEAEKCLVQELGSTLFTIAKDVKIQIEFNPAQVKAYRLIGYENRMLAKEDFNDDTKDAGELGAGHTVTALYEIVPVDADSPETFSSVDTLKYQQSQTIPSLELMTVKLRYKDPDGHESRLLQQVITTEDLLKDPDEDFRFAASVAEFGMLLRGSKYRGESSYEHVIQSAQQSKGQDAYGYRAEFIDLVKRAQQLDQRDLSHLSDVEEHEKFFTENGGIHFKGR